MGEIQLRGLVPKSSLISNTKKMGNTKNEFEYTSAESETKKRHDFAEINKILFHISSR